MTLLGRTIATERNSTLLLLFISRFKELATCQVILLLNYPGWVPLFVAYTLSNYVGKGILPGGIMRRVRRSLRNTFGLRLLRLLPFERTSFLCDLDSISLIASEYLNRETASLITSDDRIIIDLGAHYGIVLHRLAFSALKATQVFAIEPCPPNYEVLRKNIALNNLKNVSTFNLAVGDHSGIVRMIADDTISSQYRATLEANGNEAFGFPVQCVRLSELFDILGIEQADLIKIDIEGSEAKVLRDALPILTRVRKLDIEVHNALDVEVIAELLRSVGYEVVTVRAGISSGSHRVYATRPNRAATFSS